jgi:ubiquinone/menaquinone biosynthesis C-methylase UbiE
MDYDNSGIAAVYDEARALAPGVLRQWLDLLSAQVDPQRMSLIVDLGCGTGRFSEALAEYFGARVIGIDPSQEMLERARRKVTSERVIFEQASAEDLPIPDCTADLVFMSMVFHHFADPAIAAAECRRVLRDGGHVCVRNTAREADFPYRRLFPATQSLIDSELPARSHITRIFDGAGFTLAAHEIVMQVVAPNWKTFLHKTSLRAYSLLARISDEAFEEGMAALAAHAAQADPNEAVTEEVDYFLFTKGL